MGYAKLFSSIIHSTIWREADHVRIVWVTMLAMSDENGIVETSVPGLADAARVNLQECIDALNRLQAPDEYSRCPDNEGRRLEKVDGGFEILNYEKYRRKCTEEERRERNAEKQKRWRERQKNVTNSNPPLPPVTDRNQALPEITDVTKITQSDQIRSEQLRSEEEEREQLALLPPSCPKQKTSRAHQLPSDWVYKKSHCDLARELGVGIETESVKFREHAIATGRTMKNWDMAFNTWIRRSKEFASNRGGKPPVPTQGNHGLTGWETTKTW